MKKEALLGLFLTITTINLHCAEAWAELVNQIAEDVGDHRKDVKRAIKGVITARGKDAYREAVINLDSKVKLPGRKKRILKRISLATKKNPYNINFLRDNWKRIKGKMGIS